MGFRVEGVMEASLTSNCLLHACCSIHGGGWLGFVHLPFVKEFASHAYPEEEGGRGGEGEWGGRAGGG